MRRMFMLVLVALAASALLAAVAFGIAGRTASFNYSVDEAQSQYENISKVIDESSDSLSLQDIYRYILYPASVSDRLYFITDSEGRIILPSDLYTTADDKQLKAINFVYENINNEDVWTDHLAFLSPDSFMENTPLIMKIPFEKDGDLYYAIQYNLVNESGELINSYINILLLSTLAAALLMMVPTVIFVEVITEPLQEVNFVAKQYGRGDLKVRANENHVGEAGELAISFNIMANKLSDSINELTNERNKLENVFNVISEGIIVFNRDGTVTFSNDKMQDIFSKVPRKNNFSEKIQIVPFEQFWEDLADCMEAGETKKSVEESANYAYEYTIVPRFDSNEVNCIGATGFFRDITEEHKLDMTRRDYVANISHELRTPLQTLRGLIEPLADGMVKTDSDRMRYYDIILNETLRLSRLIDDMLELSKLQSRTIAFQMYPFDVNELLDSIHARFTPIMNDAGIYFSVHSTTGKLPTVFGNPDRVNQILVILLDNAKKYTPSGGSITITSDFDEDMGKVFISVADTGQGIHEYDINHIFERFFKADRARGKKGTGLGLAIAKELLTYMGEDITVESEYGKGTKFTFTLKKAEAANTWE